MARRYAFATARENTTSTRVPECAKRVAHSLRQARRLEIKMRQQGTVHDAGARS
jgi:hypothetical protein